MIVKTTGRTEGIAEEIELETVSNLTEEKSTKEVEAEASIISPPFKEA